MPRTLLTDSGRIHPFAQDAGAVAWIGSGFSVHVRTLAAKHGSVVGAAVQKGGPQRIIGRPLALAGTKALWTSYDGGNTLEVAVHTGSPTQRDRVVYVLDHMPGPAEGSYLSAVAGHGSTLVFGDAEQGCDLEYDCRRIDVTGAVRRADAAGSAVPDCRHRSCSPPRAGGSRSSRRRLPLLPGHRPTESRRVRLGAGLRPGRSPGLELRPRRHPARDRTRVAEAGAPVELPDGSRKIELRDARTGGYWIVGGEASFTKVPVTVGRVSVGTPGAVYAVGSAIYLVRAQRPQLVARAAGAPIGLSIEGHRIAWAENVRGKGRIRTVTVR